MPRFSYFITELLLYVEFIKNLSDRICSCLPLFFFSSIRGEKNKVVRAEKRRTRFISNNPLVIVARMGTLFLRCRFSYTRRERLLSRVLNFLLLDATRAPFSAVICMFIAAAARTKLGLYCFIKMDEIINLVVE